MPVHYLNPTAEPGVPIEEYALGLDEGPVRVALLANGFPGSRGLLDAFERSLAGLLPGATFVQYDKTGTDTSIPLSPEEVDEIARDCGALVAAYGH